MRPNLSVEKIAGALAVLGTSVLMAACGGDKPANAPVNSTDTPAAASTTDATKTGDSHCGASATHKDGQASCGAAKGADATKPADTSTTSAPSTPSTSTPSTTTTMPTDPKAATTTATPATSSSAKKPAVPGKKGGGASCGAGTCSAKK